MGFEKEYKHLGNLAAALQANAAFTVPSLSAKNKAFLNMLLLAYRTVDIAAALETHPQLQLSVRYEKTEGMTTRCIEVRYLFSH